MDKSEDLNNVKMASFDFVHSSQTFRLRKQLKFAWIAIQANFNCFLQPIDRLYCGDPAIEPAILENVLKKLL